MHACLPSFLIQDYGLTLPEAKAQLEHAEDSEAALIAMLAVLCDQSCLRVLASAGLSRDCGAPVAQVCSTASGHSKHGPFARTMRLPILLMLWLHLQNVGRDQLLLAD